MGSVLKQLTSRVNGLKKLSHKADMKTKLMIANGIMIGKISYGLALWGNGETAARTICGYKSFYWSTEKLLRTCNWLSINQMYWQQVMAQTHKIMLSSKPANIHQSMVSRHHHGTRTAAGMTKGFGGEIVRQSFYFSASEYKKLSRHLRDVNNIVLFKLQLKKWVQDNIPVH